MTQRIGVQPGAFIARLAADLRHCPTRSVILVMMRTVGGPGRDRSAQTTITAAVPEAGLAGPLPRGVLLGNPDSALAVIVDDRLDPTAHTGPGRPRSPMQHPLEHSLAFRLAASGIRLLEVWATPAITSASPWWDVRNPSRSGQLEDPGPAPGTLAEHATSLGLNPAKGQVVPGLDIDPALSGPVMTELGALVCPTSFPRSDDDSDEGRAAVEQALQTIAALASGLDPSPRQLAQLAVAVSRTQVAVVMLDLPGDYGSAPDRLWLQLTRSLTGPYRARPALLLAMSAHRRGDGVLAARAHRVAAEHNPDDLLASMLGGTFDQAMPPAMVDRIATTLAAKATDSLGIDLTPTPPTTA